MHNRLTLLIFLGAAWGLSSAVNAADKPSSYAANGKCYCNLPIPTSLEKEIISTPIGGQSLAQVCERVGNGPALKKNGNKHNFTVYSDMQCGHGPGLTGFSALMSDAGMSQENIGPKWDIEAAYANDAALADSSSGNNTGAATAGQVYPLRSRYIDVPSSTKVSVAERSRGTSAAASTNYSTPAQLEEDQSQIEALPLATVIPLEGSSAAESSNVITATETTFAAQDDATLISEEVETVTQVISQPAGQIEAAAPTALRVPAAYSARSRQFEYLAVTPTGYDFGGAGVRLSASLLQNDRFRFLTRAGLAEDYQEVLVGATYLQPIGTSDRLTLGLSTGLEHGRFDLEAGTISTSSTSTGVFVSALSNFEVSRRFELQGGVGYSSFFDGDPHAFGAALFHMTQKLDFIGEFEVGDNDSAGLGIRYYYR